MVLLRVLVIVLLIVLVIVFVRVSETEAEVVRVTGLETEMVPVIDQEPLADQVPDIVLLRVAEGDA